MNRPPEQTSGQAPELPVEAAMLPYLFNRLTSAINQQWLQQIRPYKLTIPRWQVLSILVAMDGSRMGKLAELAGSEQAIMSRVVDQMVREQLVEKRTARQDSRVVEVWITEKGKSIHRQLLPAACEQIEQLVSVIPAAELTLLLTQLQSMLAVLGFEHGGTGHNQ